MSLVNEPSELTLGQHCVGHVEPRVLPDVEFAQAQRVDEPVELVVSVVVLHSTQAVGHTLYTVHNRAGKVVCGIHSVILKLHL